MAAKTETYVLKARSYTHQEGEGKSLKRTKYRRGDLIELTEAEAVRLERSVEKPGASQEARKAALEAEIESLKAEQDSLAERAKAEKAEARKLRSGASSGSGGDDLESKSPDELKALADEKGLEVTGTGANGNVVKADLVKALKAAEE